MKDRPSLLTHIYRLKLIIMGLAFVLLGLVFSLVADWLATTPSASHLLVFILRATSDVLLVTGAIGIAVDFFTGRDRDRAMTENNRAVQRELLPDTVDTVLRAFAAKPADLERVATPEFLDQLATSALTLRLGDTQFAREIYADVRDQAVRAAERWHDVDVSIRLSAIAERETGGLPQFDVTVKWEYTVVPAHAVRRFACVSDKDEYHELATDVPSTSAWFMTPRPGFRANDKQAFELLQFSVDGEDRRVRRSERKSGQTYSVDLGEDVVRAGKPVRVSYVYRTITPKHGHMLFFDIEQPTKGITVEFDYSATDVSHVSVLDLVASAKRTHVQRMPTSVPSRAVTASFDGWVFPRTGFAFVWTLDGELPADPAVDEADDVALQ